MTRDACESDFVLGPSASRLGSQSILPLPPTATCGSAAEAPDFTIRRYQRVFPLGRTRRRRPSCACRHKRETPQPLTAPVSVHAVQHFLFSLALSAEELALCWSSCSSPTAHTLWPSSATHSSPAWNGVWHGVRPTPAMTVIDYPPPSALPSRAAGLPGAPAAMRDVLYRVDSSSTTLWGGAGLLLELFHNQEIFLPM